MLNNIESELSVLLRTVLPNRVELVVEMRFS